MRRAWSTSACSAGSWPCVPGAGASRSCAGRQACRRRPGNRSERSWTSRSGNTWRRSRIFYSGSPRSGPSFLTTPGARPCGPNRRSWGACCTREPSGKRSTTNSCERSTGGRKIAPEFNKPARWARRSMALTDWLFGRRLASDEEGEQCVGVLAGIPMLGLDALGSAAYGPEAALTLLIPLGTAGLGYVGPISALIIALLLVVYFSYRQTIGAYP